MFLVLFCCFFVVVIGSLCLFFLCARVCFCAIFCGRDLPFVFFCCFFFVVVIGSLSFFFVFVCAFVVVVVIGSLCYLCFPTRGFGKRSFSHTGADF